MQATLTQLQSISVFAAAQEHDLTDLIPNTAIHSYLSGEIVMQEGDRLLPRLHALVGGTVRVTKTSITGKETILRLLSEGDIFAAPALFGNGIAPANVTAETDVQVLTIDRTALLQAIQKTPEIALSMLSLFNQRLQQLHNTVHGLVSERAIVRLIRYLEYFAAEHGTEQTQDGILLKSSLSYYQIARSIGITYEECVRLFKQLQPIVSYRRGGKITVQDWKKLDALCQDSH
ncbi:Crp/Fnr family transcriptional regulator [Leptolyngbya ohadii]|uniref:Crp/Fnr family transcriptional regulator n=1 Tax=Leptolyngbya ohadii TaxID=1962290 RepID=UPI000B5A12A0|nr:Crp/Fnr family transcriptional regulator [Leptolyngbya ohadii]